MLEAPDRLVSTTLTLTGFGCRQDVRGSDRWMSVTPTFTGFECRQDVEGS